MVFVLEGMVLLSMHKHACQHQLVISNAPMQPPLNM